MLKEFSGKIVSIAEIFQNTKSNPVPPMLGKKCKKTWFFGKFFFWWEKMKNLKFFRQHLFAFIWLLTLKACLSGQIVILRRFLTPLTSFFNCEKKCIWNHASCPASTLKTKISWFSPVNPKTFFTQLYQAPNMRKTPTRTQIQEPPFPDFGKMCHMGCVTTYDT